MRALKALIALMFVLAGVVLGVLNQQTLLIDLLFTQVQARLGLLVLSCIFIGALIGGALVSLGLLTKKRPALTAVQAEIDSGKTP
jgi:uncharacterized integral membrane protein